jgi:hypothetical protein
MNSEITLPKIKLTILATIGHKLNMNELDELSKVLFELISDKEENIVEGNIEKITTLAWLDKFNPERMLSASYSSRPKGMSVRLFNVLIRYEKHFPYLEDITYEKAMSFRNFGKVCWEEFVKLKDI